MGFELSGLGSSDRSRREDLVRIERERRVGCESCLFDRGFLRDQSKRTETERERQRSNVPSSGKSKFACL